MTSKKNLQEQIEKAKAEFEKGGGTIAKLDDEVVVSPTKTRYYLGTDNSIGIGGKRRVPSPRRRPTAYMDYNQRKKARYYEREMQMKVAQRKEKLTTI